MKVFKCEMCGGSELIKEDGFYICQHCGTKYTPDEAKKLFVEGVVKIDRSESKENLLTLARRARETEEYDRAADYYREYLLDDPNDWEAAFYSVYYEKKDCRSDEIENACAVLEKLLNTVIDLIIDSELDNHSAKEACDEVIDAIHDVIYLYADKVNEIIGHNPLTGAEYTVRYEHLKTSDMLGWKDVVLQRKKACALLLETMLSIMIDTLNERDEAKEFFENIYVNRVLEFDSDMKQELISLFRRDEPDYKLPRRKGCYVATCVYGSYNCPEVWTLRRYRDSVLQKTRLGRCFISLYYTVSPHLVNAIGDKSLFRRVTKKMLDIKVRRLQENGVSGKPYVDY